MRNLAKVEGYSFYYYNIMSKLHKLLVLAVLTVVALFSRSLPVNSAQVITKSGRLSALGDLSALDLDAALGKEFQRLPLLFAIIREKLFRKILG
jgi:hypothetical protein